MATFTVTSLADSGAGSLREAISIANSTRGADEINFDSALSGGTINLNSGELLINDSLSINGLGSNLLTIDAGGLSRVFNNSSGSSSISGLKITGGYSYNGGGIFNYGNLNLADTIFTGNSAVSFGGGISNYGTLNASDTIFSDNHIEDIFFGGGGIFNDGILNVANSTFSNNSSELAFGGGILNFGILNLSKSDFTGNSASFSGGAIFNGVLAGGGSELIVNIDNSTFSSNSADRGGAIYNSEGNWDGYATLTLTNSTISNNSAEYGGGIYRFPNPDSVTITDSIISGNSATYGSNIYTDGEIPPEPIPEGDTILGGILALAIVGFTYFRKRQRHKTVQKLQKKGVLTTPQV
jgi:predicted outer membrane repeat protein